MTVTSGPGTSSSTIARPLRDASTAAAIASASSALSSTTVEAFLALAVDRLDDGRQRQPLLGDVATCHARLRDVVLGESLALAVLEDGERGRLRRDRMREACVRGDACRDRDRPVDAWRDDPVHLLGARELADRRLVLDGHDRPPVGELEADRGRVAVTGDDVEPPLPGGAVQPQLRRAGAED